MRVTIKLLCINLELAGVDDINSFYPFLSVQVLEYFGIIGFSGASAAIQDSFSFMNKPCVDFRVISVVCKL